MQAQGRLEDWMDGAGMDRWHGKGMGMKGEGLQGKMDWAVMGHMCT